LALAEKDPLRSHAILHSRDFLSGEVQGCIPRDSLKRTCSPWPLSLERVAKPLFVVNPLNRGLSFGTQLSFVKRVMGVPLHPLKHPILNVGQEAAVITPVRTAVAHGGNDHGISFS
jgi:hypothetical protein